MAGAASWAGLQTFAAGVNVGNVAQAATSTLDWYEEGTFTPDLSFGGATTGITYDGRHGYYTRIGNICTFEVRIALSSKGSATGWAQINTMPFAQSGPSVVFAAYVSGASATGHAAARLGVATAGVTRLDLYINEGAGITTLTDADVTNTSTILVSGSYRVQ